MSWGAPGAAELRAFPARRMRSATSWVWISAVLCAAVWGGHAATAKAASTASSSVALWSSAGASSTAMPAHRLRLFRDAWEWETGVQRQVRAEGEGRAQPSSAESEPPPTPVRVGAFQVARGGVTPMGKQIGIGLEGGSPTSITLRYAFTGSEGLVVGAGSLGGPYWNTPTLALHVDYLWHPNVLVRTPSVDLSWYVGGGAWLIVGERLRSIVPILSPWVSVAYGALGVRVPIGISLAMRNLPIELYLQGDPSFFVFPGLSAWMGGCAGFRFYI